MMKKKKFEGMEYFLGTNTFNGYQIIEHAVSSPQGESYCCFEVYSHMLTDGDVFPTLYDETYVKVGKEVYEHTMRMLNMNFGKHSMDIKVLRDTIIPFAQKYLNKKIST